MSLFQPATREKSKLRLGLVGPAGSGKTYTALRIAHAIAKRLSVELGRPAKIAVIDTEHGSASKYVGDTDTDGHVFAFDAVDLGEMRGQFCVENYIKCIRGAADYDVLIIDSLSHAWAGPGGVLEFVDKAAARNRGNSFAGWRDATPLHNSLIDALLTAAPHLIVTMRAKTEYIMEADSRGKMVPRKVGMQPVQRDGLDYEFDVVGDIEVDTHKLVVSKSRCSAVADGVYPKPGAEFAGALLDWLSTGVEPAKPETWADVEDEWRTSLTDGGLDLDGDVVPFLASVGKPHPSEMEPEPRRKVLAYLLAGGRPKVDAFLDSVAKDLRKNFIPRFNDLHPVPSGEAWTESGKPITQRQALVAARDEQRHAVQAALWGVASLSDVTPAQAVEALKWLHACDQGDFEARIRAALAEGGEE